MKSNIITSIISIWIVVAILVSYYLYNMKEEYYDKNWDNLKENKQSEEVEKNDNSKEENFKNYIDENIGYEIDYHVDMNVSTDQTNKWKARKFMLMWPSQEEATNLYDWISLTIRRIENNNLDEYIKEKKSQIEIVWNIIEWPYDYELNNYTWKKMKLETLWTHTNIYLTKDSYIYEISYSIQDPENQWFEKTLEKMLNSFKIK